jgi:hypothetical protein
MVWAQPSRETPGPKETASQRIVLPLFAAGALALHAALASVFPVIYGGDTIVRLCNFDKIFIAYQLPLFQALIHFTLRLFYGPAAVWGLMALISAAATTGIYVLTREATRDRRAAGIAAFLYATHPFILVYSRVPYQEPLLLAALAWGFYFLFVSERDTHGRAAAAATVLCFNVAAWTRYEGWIAAGVAVAYLVWSRFGYERRMRPGPVLRDGFLYLWPVLFWILWNHGLSPAGTFVLDPEWSLPRLHRPFFLVKTVLWWTPLAVTAMALFGARLMTIRQGAALVCLTASLLAAVVLSGHGIAPDPERFVTEREAYVPIALLTAFAGAGGARMLDVFRRRIGGPALVRSGLPLALLLLTGILGAARAWDRIASLNFDPEAKPVWEAARYLAQHRESAVILGKPLPAVQVLQYLDRAEKTGGPRGRAAARDMLLRVEAAGFDYQRILVWSWLGKERIISSEHLAGASMSDIGSVLRKRGVTTVVVLSDFTAARPLEREILNLAIRSGRPAVEFGGDVKRARIYRLQ